MVANFYNHWISFVVRRKRQRTISTRFYYSLIKIPNKSNLEGKEAHVSFLQKPYNVLHVIRWVKSPFSGQRGENRAQSNFGMRLHAFFMCTKVFIEFLTHRWRGRRTIRAWCKCSICDKCRLDWNIARIFFSFAIIFESTIHFYVTVPRATVAAMKT